jgi:hypothetical protein
MAVLGIPVRIQWRFHWAGATSLIIWPSHHYQSWNITLIGINLRSPRQVLSVLTHYMNEMFDHQLMRTSTSPAVTPTMLSSKACGRGQRLCVDYRQLNTATIIHKWSLAIMNNRCYSIHHVRVSTQMDHMPGFILTLVKDRDKMKTAIQTRYHL